MLLVRLVYFLLQHKSHVYCFRMFEEASYFLEKSGWRLKRRCRGVLGDQCEYNSELGRDLKLQDVHARIVLVLHQDGRYLIPKDSFSVALGDGVDD